MYESGTHDETCVAGPRKKEEPGDDMAPSILGCAVMALVGLAIFVVLLMEAAKPK